LRTLNRILALLGFIRGLLDDNAKLKEFAEKLEAACVAVVESKDLALLSHGSK
jgi:aspartate/tyrosine/aromatic aminotransferase